MFISVRASEPKTRRVFVDLRMSRYIYRVCLVSTVAQTNKTVALERAYVLFFHFYLFILVYFEQPPKEKVIYFPGPLTRRQRDVKSQDKIIMILCLGTVTACMKFHRNSPNRCPDISIKNLKVNHMAMPQEESENDKVFGG